MAGEDRILKILLQIQSDVGDLAKVKSGVSDVKQSLDDTTKSAFTWESAFKFAGVEEALRGVLDALKEIPNVISEGVKAGVEFNSELQQVQIGIAAALRQNMSEVFGSFGQAMQASGDVIDQLKAKANELGLSYQQNFEAYQHSVNAMLGGGVVDIQKQISLIITLNAAIKTLGLSATVTARDINEMLIGGASRTIAGRQLASGMGFPDATALDQAIQQARSLGQEYEFFTEHMKGFQEAIGQQANTFQAAMNRMHNALLDLESEAAKPIMQPLVEQFDEFTAAEKTDELRAMARTLGDAGAVALGMAGSLAKGVIEIGNLVNKYQELRAIVSSLPGGSFFSTAADAQTLNLQAIQSENLQKQYQTLRQMTLEAKSQEDQEKASAEIGQAIGSIQEGILNGQYKNTEQAKQWLENIKSLLVVFQLIAGTAQEIAAKPMDQTKQLAAMQQVEDKIKILQAEASDDKTAVVAARAAQAYDEIKKSLLEKGVLEKDAAAEAQKYKDAVLAAGNAQLAVKANARDIAEFTKEEETILQGVRQQQQLVNQSPFMTPDQKNAQLLPLVVDEMNALNSEIQKGQALLHNSALDPAQYEQVRQKIQQARFELELLGGKIQTLNFGGGLRQSLTTWVSSFGTTAQQIGKTIEGTINAGLQTFNQLLLTGKVNAQQLLQQIAQLGLTLIEQMLLQRAMAAINSKFSADQAAITGPAIAAAYSGAATAVSIATEGQADIQAPIAVAGALAAITGILVAHEGGVVGSLPNWSGGPIASDERLVVTKVGETILPTHLSNARISIPRFHDGGVVGGGGASPSTGSGGRVLNSADRIEIYNFSDINELNKKWSESTAGRKILNRHIQQSRMGRS